MALLAAPLAAVPAAPASAAEFVPGQQTRFPLPDRDAKPTGIAAGADGALWIAESNGHAIVRMATDGTTTRFPIPYGVSPTDLAAGADGTVWWVSSLDDRYGLVTAAGVVEDWAPPLDTRPKAVTVGTDGSGWFLKPGAFHKLEAVRSPGNPAGFQGLIEIGHGVSSPTSVEAINGKIWVSDTAANLIVVFSEIGVYERSISVPAPGAMTFGDGGVYVVSASTDIIKLTLDGTATGNVWHDPGAPLITDLVVPAPDEQWMTQQRGKNVTVRSQVDGIPPTVALPDAGSPSDLTVGPDGAIWYTSLGTSEVVRIARDYEAPGIGAAYRADAPPVRAYVSEPLGPVAMSDRGSGTISVGLTGTIAAGMAQDAEHPEVLIGRPSTAETTRLGVGILNFYYGQLVAVSPYQQTTVVRPKPTVERIAGADRYESAVSASKGQFPTTAATVYVVSGEKFADALSAGAVAIQAGAPLLLTNAGALPASVAAELKRLQPGKVVVVGGPASVSDAVMTQIAGSTGRSTAVERIGGADRYEVSQNLLKTAAVFSPLYIASGRTYPDALAAAPAAATGGNVVLLVDGALDSLPDSTMAFIAASRTSPILVGGPATISAGIQAQLQATGRTVTRVGGADRYETATLISRFVLTPSGTLPSRVPSNPVLLRDRDVVYLASGENYPDALAGGVVAGLARAPLYITPKNCVPRPVLLDIGSTGATKVVVLGGPNTLATPVESLTACP